MMQQEEYLLSHYDDIVDYHLDGQEPSFVDIPIWHTHNIINTGDYELLTLFWTNEFYDPEDTDTYFEHVNHLLV